MTCYSTEYERHWKADFGETRPFVWSEYGDIDHDGLPNWFEMYWFGKFGDMSTAAVADPKTIAPAGRRCCRSTLTRLTPQEAYSVCGASQVQPAGVVPGGPGSGCRRPRPGFHLRDQSGNDLDLAAARDQFKPHLVKNAWHGRPVIQFDGVQNSLLCRMPEGKRESIMVIAARSAPAEDQVNRIQEGHGNRLVSIPTTTKADYMGGVAIVVDNIGWWKGDVAVATCKANPASSPSSSASATWSEANPRLPWLELHGQSRRNPDLLPCPERRGRPESRVDSQTPVSVVKAGKTRPKLPLPNALRHLPTYPPLAQKVPTR